MTQSLPDDASRRDEPRVAPWGSPPTPLLSRWHRNNVPDVRLPPWVRAENPAVNTVGDLDTFWDGRSSPISRPARRALLDVATRHRPPSALVVIHAEIDRLHLLKCPLRRRTANSLTNSGFFSGSGPMSVKDLLAIRGFGIASLLDLMCISEAALPVPPDATVPATATNAPPKPQDVRYEGREWRQLADVLELLLVAAHEFHGAATVADVFELNLAELAEDVGIAEAAHSLEIRDLTAISMLSGLIDAVRDLRTAMSDPKVTVFERILFAPKPATLEEIGRTFGVSRERIRQIKIQVDAEIRERVGSEIAIIAATLRREADPMMRERNLSALLDAPFASVSLNDPAVHLTRQMVERELDYDCVRGISASPEARTVLDGFRRQAVRLTDEVGLIDEDGLRAFLPDDEWHRLYELLVERCGFARISDRLALRATKKARAKAAILAIGRLATIDEIIAESGLPRPNLAGLLSDISGLARASKTKWGLADWIEDEYEGIVGEIIQRINEDGGATTLKRLITELPPQFEVKEASVRAVASSQQFVVNDGVVRLAEESDVALRDIYEVVEGVTSERWPYWSFRVRSAYFDGYSLAGVPPEIAHFLGCPQNGSIRAVVSRPTGCRRISVSWRLASVSGASVGYISQPLSRLGVSEGDRVRIVLVKPEVVEFRLYERRNIGRRRDNDQRSGDGVETSTAGVNDLTSSALLEQLKHRRRIF